MNSKLRLERGLFLLVLVVLQINKIIRQWQAFSNTVYQNIPWGFELIFKQIFLLFRHYLFPGLHTFPKFTIFHFIDTKISHNDFSRFTKKNASSVMKAKAIGCYETRKWGLHRFPPHLFLTKHPLDVKYRDHFSSLTHEFYVRRVMSHLKHGGWAKCFE